ncbi:MAG: phosphopentomutase [Firmicutes bacterium]|nr:phosphopentomutase [Bacillota bacterium]
MSKRVFLIVLDSYGIGELPDAYKWNDRGSNTLGAIRDLPEFDCPNLKALGLFNIEGVGGGVSEPKGSFARMAEVSAGKDTTTGHWEMAGLISENPFPTYPDGFPEDVVIKLENAWGRGTLCNKPYSGTEVIKDFGKEHVETGKLIIYTSADSVLQIAAHEDVVPIDELYHYCEQAREILKGEHGVGRVIARPFEGEWPYRRTTRRHDFSLEPSRTMLDVLKEKGLDVISVGKIYDIFAGKGLTESNRTVSNADGMDKTMIIAERDFEGLCFINLVEFDMTYGHRNDAPGYARASTEFDMQLGLLLPLLRDDDILFITADHGCDPSTPSTDHSREYVPMIAYGKRIKEGVDLGTLRTFADLSASILEYFGEEPVCKESCSFLDKIFE